jgi:hypothetical protein
MSNPAAPPPAVFAGAACRLIHIERQAKREAAPFQKPVQRGLATPPIAVPLVAKYRRFLSATLGAETLMFMYLRYRRSRNTAAFLELHRAAVYRGPAVAGHTTKSWPFLIGARLAAGACTRMSIHQGKPGAGE